MVSSKMSALVTAAVLMMVFATTQVAEGQSQVPSCASKLVSCVDYLNSTKPPSSCCDPLREAVTKELSCLCNLYANPALLSSFNINVTQALKLPGNCGIPGDLSACHVTASGPSGSATKPPAVPGGNNDNNGVDKIVGTGLSSLLLLLASLMLC